jgi:HlyD family secretion protein
VDVPVDEGQAVQAGALLVSLDDREAREAVRLAAGVVEQGKARLKQLATVAGPAAAETKKQAEATLKNAQAAYDRALKLQHQGFATGATLDDARKALDVAKSQVQAAGLQVATAMPGGMDYLLAQTQLAQSEASLRSAEAKLSYYQIKAPRDGTLISRNVERGNTVQPGVMLMVLAPAGDTQIVVQIDEVNLGLLQLDQKVIVSADAYPKQVFDARLAYINPSIDAQRGSVEVKLAVPNPPAYLRQDMTVSAEIEVAHRQQAIVVEASSVRDLAGAKPWVMVVEGGRARRRDIAVGTIGDTAVEVLSGLAPGELVARGPTATLSDGQRVRAAGNG